MNIIASKIPYLVYILPLLSIFVWALRRKSVLEKISHETWQESLEAGLIHAPSLHPVIDPLKCIGCQSCIHACPEFPAHQVLGMVNHKAILSSPTDCIGHGACQQVCPVDAISLVFGNAERGVDIPDVNPDFSTNIPGIYIAGELGGMGLIRNAMMQGIQAMDSIAKSVSRKQSCSEVLDVLIVGSGPAGIAASLSAMQHELSYCTLEQNNLGGSIANFPRGKIVMTAPVDLPIIGKMPFKETTKEKLIEFWGKIQKDTGMQVQYGTRFTGIESCIDGVFTVNTDKGSFRAKNLLLALGRRGTPRKLGIPGEEQHKVTYTFLDSTQYRGQSVLVVGGGDSALEAACTIAEEDNTQVTLSYRSGAFERAKKRNRTKVESLAAQGHIQVLLESNLNRIDLKEVHLSHKGNDLKLANDAAIICAGGLPPNGLLKEMGIVVETKYGVA